MTPGPLGAANVLSPLPVVLPKRPPKPLPKFEPPSVAKVDVVEVPKVPGPADPKPDETDAALSPNVLLEGGSVLLAGLRPNPDA